MAESLGTIYYDVDANLEPLLGKMRQAEAALGGLGSEMKKTDQGAAQMQKSFDKTERSAASLGGQLNGLTQVIRGVVAAMAIREMAGMVQQYQAMAERVQMATRSADEFEMVQRRLQSTADGTYRSLSEAQELFIRTADSIRDMGYSLDQAIDIQDSMSYAFVTNATSADRAQAAISQFTKAVNTGKVSADQWETITSAIPSVINDIAEASGRSASEVRALGAAGKLAARDLTEGLRKSLDDTRAAAGNMATDLIDAGVRVRNALTTVLVALEEQTGGIQMVTDGIIAASEAVLEFGQDAEKMESFINLATTAAASLAAVIAGRLLTSLGGATAALYQNTIAARAKAAADLQAAQTAVALAAQNLIQAQAAERAAVGLSTHAAAARALTAAQAQATAATATLGAAQRAMATSFSVATAAANGLRTAMAFLGGPAGIVLLVAAAFLTMGRNAKMASSDIQELIGSVDKFGTRTLEFRRIELEKSLADQEKAAARAAKAFEYVSAEVYHGARGQEIMAARTAKAGKDLEEASAKAQEYRDALAAVNRELERRASGADVGPQAPPGWTPPIAAGGTPQELSEFQKLEQSLKNQAALAKLTGLARAELTALQRLGADATEEERQRIKELVGEIYRLEEAQKAAQKAEQEAQKAEQERIKTSEEARRAAADNASVIAGLREQLYQTTLAADDLAARQAELSLNDYATPEQVEQVRALARELYAAQQEAALLEQRRSAFTGDAAGAIRGQVSPLSGGAFDDQAARYAAEAAAEQERYAAQLERLREAKELEIEVIGGYQALEEQMAQEHADRMAQIENAKNQVMLKAGEQGFGAMADIMKTAFGEQSAAYKVAFAAQKAFAIAQSIMAIQQGIAMAAANPWPLNLAAMASVAAATAGLVSNIASVTMGGGRLAGGPVSAGRMYRVNENGAPEVFSAANGQQFMIPNQRGEVISNRNATAGGGGVVINIHNAPQGTVAESSQDQDGQQMIDIWVADFMSDGRTASAVQGKFGLSPQGR